MQKHFLSLGCVLAFVALFWWYPTAGHVAYTMDSLTYRDVTSNLLAGRFWMATNVSSLSPEYTPLSVWPPGYSILWGAISSTFQVDIDLVPKYLNPALLALTTLFVFRIALEMSGSNTVALVVAAVNALTPTSMVVYGHAWSETLVIPITILIFTGVWKYAHSIDRKERMRCLLVITILLALANWTRYSAIAFLPLTALNILLLPVPNFKQRCIESLIPSAGCLVLITPLWIHNYLVSGHIAGSNRGGPPRNIANRLIDDLRSVSDLINHAVFNFDLLLRAHLMVPMLIMAAVLLFQRFKSSGLKLNAPIGVWMPLLWATSNILFLLFARAVQTQIDLDYRMLAVATPFMVLALVLPVKSLWMGSISKLKKALTVTFLGLLVNTGLSEAVRVHENLSKSISPGWRARMFANYRDLTDASSQTRALKRALESLPKGTFVVTDYRALYIRYIAGVSAYQLNGVDICLKWVEAAKSGILLTGYSDETKGVSLADRWVGNCFQYQPGWQLIEMKGPAAHSMFLNE